MKHCIPIGLALALGFIHSACAADSQDGSLLEAHLVQARAIAPTKERPGSDEGLKKLKADIEARRALWEGRIAERTGVAELLKGIPQATLDEAAIAADDRDKASALLENNVRLSLLLALASQRNPDTREAFQNWRASLRRFEQAAYLEDLLSQYRSFVREVDTQVGPQTNKPMTSAFPSALALKGELVDAEAEIARLNYLQTLRAALNQTANEFFEIQSMAHELGIMKQGRDLTAQIESAVRNRVETGSASQTELLKLRTMLANLDDQIAILNHKRQHQVAQINILLGLPPGMQWGELLETDLRDDDIPLQAALDRSHNDNQEFLKAQKDAEMQATMVRMAEVMLYPPGPSAASRIAPSRGAEAGPTRDETATFPADRMTSNESATFGSNAAYIDELRVRVRQTREKIDGVQAKTDFAVYHALFMVHTSRRNQKTYSEINVPNAKQAFETLKKRLSSGDGNLTEVLEAAKAYLDETKLLNDARREHNTALTDLQDAMGRTAANVLPAVIKKDAAQ